MGISNAIELYILFNTDSQEPLFVTTEKDEMTTAITDDYAGMTGILELRIYEESDSGDLELSERIPFPVWLDGMFMTQTAQTPLPEEPDYGVWDTDFEKEQQEEVEEKDDRQLLLEDLDDNFDFPVT